MRQPRSSGSVNATRDAAKAALEAAHLKHQILTFTEANHAFFNDTGARFNAPASQSGTVTG